jgi:hypothetical protein
MFDDIKPAGNGKNPLFEDGPKPKETKSVATASVSDRTTAGELPEVRPNPSSNNKPPKKPRKKISIGKLSVSVPDLNKRQWALIGFGSILLITTLGIAAWQLFKTDPPPPPPPPPVVEKEEPPAPTTVASPLTGVLVEPELAKLPVTGVMIENSPEARPQSGLNSAGVVFEAVAEGGITRFLALYQEAQPGHIGPIRSVRPYYLDWAVPFDAPIAHVGGSAEALNQISRQNIKTLNQFRDPEAYQRVSSRYAPHNMYSSRKQLLEAHKKRGFTKSDFTSWPRKEEKPLETPKAGNIDFAISSFLYNPKFTYIPETNSYNRVMNGRPHVDERTNRQISPKVVIGIVVPKGFHPNGIHTTYDTSGKGKAIIFQDGDVIQATWEKKNRQSMITFKNASGSQIELNRGNTWVSVVGVAGGITHSP